MSLLQRVLKIQKGLTPLHLSRCFYSKRIKPHSNNLLKYVEEEFCLPGKVRQILHKESKERTWKSEAKATVNVERSKISDSNKHLSTRQLAANKKILDSIRQLFLHQELQDPVLTSDYIGFSKAAMTRDFNSCTLFWYVQNAVSQGNTVERHIAKSLETKKSRIKSLLEKEISPLKISDISFRLDKTWVVNQCLISVLNDIEKEVQAETLPDLENGVTEQRIQLK